MEDCVAYVVAVGNHGNEKAKLSTSTKVFGTKQISH